MFPNKRGALSRDEARQVRLRVEAAVAVHGGTTGAVPMTEMQSGFAKTEEAIDVMLENFYDCHDAFDRLMVIRQQLEEDNTNLTTHISELQADLIRTQSIIGNKNSQVVALQNQKMALEQKTKVMEGDDQTLMDLDLQELNDLLGTLTNTISKIQV